MLSIVSHSGSENEAYAMDFANKVFDPLVDKGYTEAMLGSYMLYRRAATERAEMANPFGITKEVAERIREAVAILGPAPVRPLYKHLDGQVDNASIAIAVACLQNESHL